MKFCLFSSPREKVKPTFFDMFLNMRLNQRNVPFGNGLTKRIQEIPGREVAGFSLGGEESTKPRRLKQSQTFSTFRTSQLRPFAPRGYSARSVSTRCPCSSIGLDITFNGHLDADSTGPPLRYP
jgi:hypothetical protein